MRKTEWTHCVLGVVEKALELNQRQLDRLVTVSDPNKAPLPSAAELIKQIDRLDLSERLKIIEHLLLRQSASIVTGSNHIGGSVTFQINLVNSLDPDQIGEFLKVLSHRIATEGKQGPD